MLVCQTVTVYRYCHCLMKWMCGIISIETLNIKDQIWITHIFTQIRPFDFSFSMHDLFECRSHALHRSPVMMGPWVAGCCGGGGVVSYRVVCACQGSIGSVARGEIPWAELKSLQGLHVPIMLMSVRQTDSQRRGGEEILSFHITDLICVWSGESASL